MNKKLTNTLLVTILLSFTLLSRGHSFQADVQRDTMTSKPSVQSPRGRWVARLIYEWKSNMNDRRAKRRCGPRMTGSWSTCL